MLTDGFRTFGELIRIGVIGVGFIAMWSLWVARDRRSSRWSNKMRDIWLCHMLFVAATIEANLELLYRAVFPTVATFLYGLIMLLTIKGVFEGDHYTKDNCEHREE